MPTDFEAAIEEFVKSSLDGYQPSTPDRRKAIHDALWGTITLSPAEIALLDCPLLQRLRSIHQTGFAFYVYPSANHSRLEHSIGVLAIATRLVESLNSKKGPNLITPLERQQLRLAALLHDCGHGILSHISEHFYEQHPWITDLKKDSKYAAAKAHELMSYMIVKSGAFDKFFTRIREKYGETDESIGSIDAVKVREIANLIIGRHPSPDKAYLAGIINGPFDADKLDYIARDSYFTGLRLAVDIERLLYSLDVAPVETETGTEQRLVALASAAPVLEQILFSKIQLYPALYQHAKVKATDSMLIAFLEYMRDLYGSLSKKEKSQIKLSIPTDFLLYADYDLLNVRLHHEDSTLQNTIYCLRDRRLWLKALVISSFTVEKNMPNITRWIEDAHRQDLLDGLRKEIHSRIPDHLKGTVYDIVVDFPKFAPLNEAALQVVLQPDNEVVSLNSLFPAHDWLQTYVTKKWKGHVFCPEHLQREVNKAAIEVLESRLDVKFKSLATGLANLR
jgi:HD superfamily phosphohydrolase